MEPVEHAFRARLTAPSMLHAIGRAAPFALRALRRDGIVIELGAHGTRRLVTWNCLGSISAYLLAKSRWIKSGGVHSVDFEPGTLDSHLKRYVRRDVANWVSGLLAAVRVVDVDAGPRLHLRL